MIRLVYVLRRKENLSLAEFQTYWKEKHGPLVAKHSTTMKVRKYIQSHTLDDPANEAVRESRGAMEAYDGVADLWWDSEEALLASAESEEYQAAATELFEDEQNFIDFSRSCFYFTYEVPQVNPTPENIVAREKSRIVKLCFFAHHLDSLTLEEAQFYWRANHGPLIRSNAQTMAIKRYIQVHQLNSPLNDMSLNPRGTMEKPFMGHAELWYDRAEIQANAEIPEAQKAGEAAKQDEAKFIDFSTSALWFAKEHIFVDR